jgi:exonuclease III
MKIASWNCRGLGSRSKEEEMQYLLCTSNPYILLVQETKLSDFLQSNTIFWKKGAGVVVSARGAFGGIGSPWSSSTFELLTTDHCTHWILTNLLHKKPGNRVCIFNIYVPVLPSKKKKMLEPFKRVS